MGKSKGTSSFGKRMRKTLHIHCRRCGRRAYNVKKKRCSACGYGSTQELKHPKWRTKKITRKFRLR